MQQNHNAITQLIARIAFMAKYGEAIRERREVLGLHGPDLALKSQELEAQDPVAFQRFSQQTFSRWESDRTGVLISASHPRRLRALAYLLDWSAAQMNDKVGINPGHVPGQEAGRWPESTPPSQYVEVPLNRRVEVYPAGTGPAWDDEVALDPLWLPADLYPDKRLVGLRAMSSSMEPYLPEGSIAVIVHDDGMVKPGDFCGIRMSDDGVVVKRFVRELENGILLLESLNPDPDEDRLFTAPLGSRVFGPVVRRVLEG